MKSILIFLTFFLLVSCNKPKTVLICGDHICINKTEAEQYFEENLSIEVKIIDKKVKKEIDLVELNLRENKKGKRVVGIFSKKNIQNKKLKTLSNKEVSQIRNNIKNKKEKKKIVKKLIKKNNDKRDKVKKIKINNTKNAKIINKNVNKNQNEVFDVCTILKKCNIDEISKYLLDKGKNKDFPDITMRQ